MKKFLPIMLMLLLAGCSSNLDKLNGKWQCDPSATLAKAEANIRQNMDNPLLGGIMMAMLQGMVIEVNATGKKITMTMGKEKKTSDFTVVSDSGNKVVLTATGGNMDFVIMDKDTMEMHGADANKKEQLKVFVFKRAKPKEGT